MTSSGVIDPGRPAIAPAVSAIAARRASRRTRCATASATYLLRPRGPAKRSISSISSAGRVTFVRVRARHADAAGGGAFATLMAAVQDAADQGLLRDGVDAGAAAVTAWASVHGLASLILEGAIGIRSDQRGRARQVASAVVALVLAGLRR